MPFIIAPVKTAGMKYHTQHTTHRSRHLGFEEDKRELMQGFLCQFSLHQLIIPSSTWHSLVTDSVAKYKT
jgi:hypothetical protein